MGIEYSGSDWDRIVDTLRGAAEKTAAPSVSGFADRKSTPFQILVSTIISLRTKDTVTVESSEKLFNTAPDPVSILKMDVDTIASLIYPAGFYRTKARNIKSISKILLEKHEGLVPRDIDKLLKLPGVGRKTANLTLGLSYGIPLICVDTHVHRIPNRMGWIKTKTPAESEPALEEILPQKYWIEINRLLVVFGQTVCVPVSPKCSECPFKEICPRIGVERSR